MIEAALLLAPFALGALMVALGADLTDPKHAQQLREERREK